jgi:uncharacterized membrane protein
MSTLNNLSDLIGKIKFKYSIVMILIIANIFILIYPSMLNSMSDKHWQLLNDVSKTFLMLLGMAIGFYFNKKNENEDVAETKTP